MNRGRVWGSGLQYLDHALPSPQAEKSLDPWDQSCVSGCGFMYQPATNFTYTDCASCSVSAFLSLFSRFTVAAQPLLSLSWLHGDTNTWSYTQRVKVSCVISFGLTFGCDHWLNWDLKDAAHWCQSKREHTHTQTHTKYEPNTLTLY